MNMLASDVANPHFAGATNPDSLLHVQFYMRSEQDNFKSEKEGRPIFFETPYIRINTPGNQLSEIDTPVRAEHKIRFPIQWAAFQNAQTPQDQIVGTPVDQWPTVSRAQADELKGIKFFTVEQIANASDLQLQRLGMNGQVLQQKARAFLTTAKDHALEQHQAAELVRKDTEIKELNDRLARLENMVESKSVAKRKYAQRKKPEAYIKTAVGE